MIIRPGGKVKPKSKTRHDIAGVGATPHYSTTSDDIWMKNWGYESEGMFEAAKEAEMSVSDPEEYLVSRSDEDVLFPPHMPTDADTGTLNSEQHHSMLGPGDMLGSRDNEDDYVTSIEFNECVERGLFCREADSLPVIHYHCPCCIKHSETTIQEIEQHYRHCVSTMSNQNALFTSICKHDEYITFQECRTLDQDCPAREVKLPIHYHCPCCLIFTQQSIGQVVRHQLTCCKTLTMLQPSQLEMNPIMSQTTDSMCTHDLSVIRFRLCFNSYCIDEDPTPGPNLRKNLHFHCMCCNMYCDSKLRTLRKHQRICCAYSRFGSQLDVQPKVLFLLETSVALEQHLAIVANNNRKRNISNVTADPMSILATRTKVQKKASSVLAEIDSSIFSKCMDGSPICIVNERYRRAHYHCPICKVYTSRRLARVKLHYSKCSKPKPRAKPRGQPLDLQVELIDKLNRVFLVRGSNQGPGLPCHVIYRAGPNSNFMHCEYGCKMDKNVAKIRCKHLEACEEYVRSTDELTEAGADSPPLDQISMFYSFDESMKNAVFLLSQTCAEIRVPIIRPFYPNLSSANKSIFTYFSVSTCTTPTFVSRCQRVVVTYNERSQTFKCKCGSASVCVHVLASQLYHSHFVVNSMLCEETLEKGQHFGDSSDDNNQAGFSQSTGSTIKREEGSVVSFITRFNNC